MSEGMLYYVARIIGDLNPQDIIGTRGTIGTGFFITVPNEADPKVRHPYFVTAAHVLDDQLKVEIQAPNPQTGQLYDPEGVSDWLEPLPNVDIAVSPCDWLKDDKRPRFAEAIERVIPTQRIAEIRLANTIEYIGILTTFDRPMVRTGTVGMLNQDGIPHAGGYEYPCHMVDCRSYAGFSGSPCYVQIGRPVLKSAPAADPTWDQHASSEGEMHYYHLLAGMFTQHLADDLVGAPASRYGVGVMLRGQEIRKALMTDELKQHRREQKGKLITHSVVPTPPRLKNVSAAKTAT
jgi:hypothetical protein